MTGGEADKDKSNYNTVNTGNTGNTMNTGNNTPYTPYTPYAPNTPHTSHAPQIPSTSYPQMFYYQPFRPHAGHVNPTGMYPLLQPHVQTYGYYQHPMPVPMPFHMNPQRPFNGAPGYPPVSSPVPVPAPVTILPKGATLQNNKTEKPESPQKPAQKSQRQGQSHTQVQVKKPAPQTDGNISPLVSSYNLDDPEELEKWKAERRKKFPSGRKESLETAQVDESKEEGALSESDNENINNVPQKRKKTCKYFARGKCTRGDSCQFEHSISPSKPKRPNTTGTAPISSRPTIFENLLKIEEKDSMIKFYECIKLILQK